MLREEETQSANSTLLSTEEIRTDIYIIVTYDGFFEELMPFQRKTFSTLTAQISEYLPDSNTAIQIMRVQTSERCHEDKFILLLKHSFSL